MNGKRILILALKYALLAFSLPLFCACTTSSLQLPRPEVASSPYPLQGSLKWADRHGDQFHLSSDRESFVLRSQIQLANIGDSEEEFDPCCGKGGGGTEEILYHKSPESPEILCVLPERRLYFRWSDLREKSLKGEIQPAFVAFAQSLKLPDLQRTLGELTRDPEEQLKEKFPGGNTSWRALESGRVEIEKLQVAERFGPPNCSYHRIIWDPQLSLSLRQSGHFTVAQEPQAWSAEFSFHDFTHFEPERAESEPVLETDFVSYRELFADDSFSRNFSDGSFAPKPWAVQESQTKWLLFFHRQFLNSKQRGPWLVRRETWRSAGKEVEFILAWPSLRMDADAKKLLPEGASIPGVASWDSEPKIGKQSSYEKEPTECRLSWIDQGMLWHLRSGDKMNEETLLELANSMSPNVLGDEFR